MSQLYTISAFYYAAELVQDKTGALISIIGLFIAIDIVIYRIWKKHNKVYCPLSEEYKARPDCARLDLSNRFSLGFILYLIIYMGIIYLMSWYIMVNDWSNSTTHQLGLYGLTTLFFLGIYMPSMHSIWKNKYIIDNNTLLIVEYNSFRKESEIRIPISAIEEVYLEVQLVNPYMTKVVIRVHGIEKKLNSYSHPVELAKEIQLRQKYPSIA